MSENKKYFYMKVKDNFYDSNEIIALESLPDGVLYSNILMKMYLKSLKQEGKLMINEFIPMDSNTLAQIVRQPQAVVEKAIDIFKQLKLIDILDDGAIYMLNIQNYIGKSTTEADRIRNYRKKIEQEKLGCTNVQQMNDKCTPKFFPYDSKVPSIVNCTNVQQMNNKSTPELEIELELEIDTLHYTYLYIKECCEKIFQTEDENLIKLLEQCDLSISNEFKKSFIKENNYLLLMIYSINEIYQSLDKPFTNKLDYVLLSNLFKKTETKLEINIKELKQDEEYDYKRFLDYYIKSIKNQLKEKKED